MTTLRRRPSAGRARPPPLGFADTGLDQGLWRERARRYQEYFGVASEL